MLKDQVIVTMYDSSYDNDVKRLCDLFYEESLKEYGLTVTEQRLAQMTVLCKENSFFLLYNDKVVGLIAGMQVESLTNGKMALQEVIWYVEKDFRSHGKRLLTAFEQYAKNIGMSSVVMGLMINSQAERLDAVYRRLGYKKFEVQYMKEL